MVDQFIAALGAHWQLLLVSSALIFLAAIEDGAEDAEAINKFIGSYSTEDGASGPISFDENGDIEQSTIYVYKVEGGKLDTENPEPIE